MPCGSRQNRPAHRVLACLHGSIHGRRGHHPRATQTSESYSDSSTGEHDQEVRRVSPVRYPPLTLVTVFLCEFHAELLGFPHHSRVSFPKSWRFTRGFEQCSHLCTHTPHSYDCNRHVCRHKRAIFSRDPDSPRRTPMDELIVQRELLLKDDLKRLQNRLEFLDQVCGCD